MIFLMNDAVLDLDLAALAPPARAGRFRALSLAFVTRLGCDLYSEEPLLHRADPERARRLASLIVCKAPHINAALFAAPCAGCAPEEVTARLAQVDVEVLARLHARQARDALTPFAADAEVWRRMAA